MSSESALPVSASVVFLRAQEFARRPVAEQARLRAQLEAAVATGTAALKEEDRIVLYAPDGAAIVVLGNPSGALDAAQRAFDGTTDLLVCVGINHGPVRLAPGPRDDTGLVGDGIDSAAIVAKFATPNRLLVSRSFREALADQAPDRAEELHSAGTFTDDRVRAHELFFPDSQATWARRRRMGVFLALAVVGILGLGTAARFVLQGIVESRQPAFLQFDIRPNGEIYVDGVMKGRTPSLTRLQVAPGAHTIEIRSGKFKPHVVEVNAKPGEHIPVTHSFTSPAAQKPRSVLDRLKFWQR